MKTRNKIFVIFFFCFALTIHAKDTPVNVVINGVNQAMEENIRSNLSLLQEEHDEILLTEEKQIRKLSEQEIFFALQPFGYYSPDIQTQIMSDPSKITFTIALGQPTLIEAIHFKVTGEGEKDPLLQRLAQYFQLKKGMVLNHENYDQDKKAILSKVIQSGYLNAVFSEHRVEVNTQLHFAEIFLTLQTGSRHYFGPITYETTKLSDDLMDRYLTFQQGEVYSPEKTLALQSYLTQSDYFSSVNVKALSTENSNYVPIVVELTDAKPNQYLFGFGYGTDTGIRGKLGWTRRVVNSMGHRFSAEAQVAEIYHKYQFNYSIPGKHPQSDQLKFKAGYFEDEYTEKRSQIYEAGVTQEREIDGWQRRLSLNYQQERFDAFITNEPVLSKLILPSVTFIQIKRDDAATPTRGRRIELSLRGSIDALFSDTTFFQSYLQVKWLHAFNESTKALIRAEGGFTIPDDSARLPLSQRFFAGGDLSIRGYGYRSLPNEIDKDGNRHPVGGAYLGVGSIEIDKMIKSPFGVFTFIDFGNAFRKINDDIAVGTGVGIQWQTRLGPIKFAIAKPLTKTTDSWRIHAQFGPEL